MRWGDFRRSDNVEDRTDGAPESGGGFGGGFPGGGGVRIGGGALVVIVIASLIFGVNPLEMLGMMEGGTPVAPQAPPPQAAPGYGPQHAPAPGQPPVTGHRQDASHDFVSAILGDTEDVWGAIFKAQGAQYVKPRLVLFHRSTDSDCGQYVPGVGRQASATTGPFYCSVDQKVYLDSDFFHDLAQRFGAPGEFAQAYVIAHEVGHHVQNLRGTMRKVDQAMQRTDTRGRNALSVQLELQADCYAGVWGYFAQKRGKLEPGDLESGFRAAQAVGDDQIQKRTRGYVVPETFTHG
ncbi:MAG TPA: neutral zinc metallopeptidase, partial [Casimicrobiaceae bacterium]|nr:neutral zinc metallopeptidase [Casimicrobiaceae bacterium]